MHILHIGSCNVLAGGPALSTWLTIKGLRNLGENVSLIMPKITQGRIIDEAINPIYTSSTILGNIAYIPDIKNKLDIVGNVDIYHIQGVWMYYGKQMATYARRKGKPYVVTLRGMLYPEALNHNYHIKWLSLLLYIRNMLKYAACIQATCHEEMEHYRNLGFKNPVAVIPNPIETEGVIERQVSVKPTFRIGYLGRVHPRKRIERLIYSMANLRDKLSDESELLIIGGGDNQYEDFLHKEVERLDLGRRVRFTGFLSGKEKEDAIESLSLLVVPSDFENFGNIVTEALVHGVPVIASTGMPWQELPEHNCGWWISNDQETIDKTILEAYQLGSARLREMGLNGRELVRCNYSVEALGKKMKSLYEWILGQAPKPDFVYE